MPLRRGVGANVEAGRFHEPGIHHGSYLPGRNYDTVAILPQVCSTAAEITVRLS